MSVIRPEGDDSCLAPANPSVTDYWFTRFSGLVGINSALPEVPISTKKTNHRDQGHDICCIDHLLWLSSVLLKANCHIYELHCFHRSPPRNNGMELIQEADRSKWTVHSNHSIKCFTEADIDRMTKSYRTCLGRGAFGEVYKGVLEDGSMVAVKRFIHNVKENFAKELIVHREINHKNVVRLIGCCKEENALMLVTEYIANGNLSDVLHHEICHIPLDIRLGIATECAEALAYMHSNMYTKVIHGDIKPSNILLDINFHAKLSDFGISRLANTDKTLCTKNVIGSIGYMDPLFALDGQLTVMYDVYSFGVVLLELITRKKATASVDNVNTVSAFTNALASGVRGVKGMFDADITSKNNMKIFESVAKLAGECLTMKRDKRPDMIDVVERLRVLRKASHQDQGQQRVGLFSWVRKSKPQFSFEEMKAASTVLAKILPSSDDLCRQFSFKEMKAATNNFDKARVLGEDGLSRVYLGMIDGGATKVAVKRMSDICDFQSLIEMMSKLSHVNLVPLIGYCHDRGSMFLVYEYMFDGNLYGHIHCTHGHRSWKWRMETCIDAARGLRYLHESQIIHANVKTAEILLNFQDGEWLAKITDALPPSCRKIELPYEFFDTLLCFDPVVGYEDCEYRYTHKLTEKSDVYSFGVVLLEVLCAQSAYSLYGPDEKQRIGLVSWVLKCKKDGDLDHIVDPYLKGKINPQCLDKFVSTAEKCLSFRGIDRPSMGDVISDLEYALQLQESAEASEGLGIKHVRRRDKKRNSIRREHRD